MAMEGMAQRLLHRLLEAVVRVVIDNLKRIREFEICL